MAPLALPVVFGTLWALPCRATCCPDDWRARQGVGTRLPCMEPMSTRLASR
jgi:hypothetical protein